MNPQDYANFLHEIKKQIRDRQLQAMRSVNRELVELYWAIGGDDSPETDGTRLG